MCASVQAQPASEAYPTLTLGALLHGEVNYGWVAGEDGADTRSRVGFGLRRTRLRATARVGPKAGGFIHLDADGGTFGVLDAFLFYDVSPDLRLRLGRMASAQPRAFILTPLFAMDATDRAAIALLWNRGTLGVKGRDFGLDLRYRGGQAEAILFLHNGDGRFDNLVGNYQANIVGDATGGVERGIEDMAVSGYVAFFPEQLSGLEVGGYAGYNGSGNPSTAVDGEGRDYLSYAAHLYWGAEPGSRPVRLKADVIGVLYEELSTVPEQQTLGFSALGAVGLHRSAELFGRFEVYEPNLDVDEDREVYFTTGIHFSPSSLRGGPFARERLTLGYSARFPEADGLPTHHLIVLQAQVFF